MTRERPLKHRPVRPRNDDDDWYEEPAPFLMIGSATPGHGEEPETIATLWVPDPKSRHGWREHFVEDEEPEPRPIGFRTKE